MLNRLSHSPSLAALAGLLCTLPVILLNSIAGGGPSRLRTFFLIGGEGGFRGNPVGYLATAAALGLLLVGAWVALRPLRASAGEPGRSRWASWLVNGGVALLLVALFALITIALGVDIVRCDLLGIPNCD